jgi:hypothetical protein
MNQPSSSEEQVELTSDCKLPKFKTAQRRDETIVIE